MLKRKEREKETHKIKNKNILLKKE